MLSHHCKHGHVITYAMAHSPRELAIDWDYRPADEFCRGLWLENFVIHCLVYTAHYWGLAFSCIKKRHDKQRLASMSVIAFGHAEHTTALRGIQDTAAHAHLW